ncbi:hypothetical protein EVC14_034 [Rhizobium phage RHph_I3_18]|nr:hypothetical protein EVC14_034 [Rhizobium phage RHph_I3_18]
MAKKSSENPPCYVLRDGDRLIGEMEMDREMIRQFPAGQRIRVELRTGRVPSRLRFYWAFLRKVVEATNCAPNEKVLHQLVKLRTGHTDDVIMGGYIVKVPASVAFENMDEPTFQHFLLTALDFIGGEFGITPEDVERAA